MTKELQEEINQQALDAIRFRVLRLERENAKTSEKSDTEMVKAICAVIEEEVKRYTSKGEQV